MTIALCLAVLDPGTGESFAANQMEISLKCRYPKRGGHPPNVGSSTLSINHEHAVAQLAAIIDSSDDAIISKSIDGVIQTWNSGAERLYGYSAQEVLGRTMMSLLPKSFMEQEREILLRVSRGERVHHPETVRIHKSGRPVPVSLTISPMRDSEGNITGVSHIARDLTEATQLKRKLQLTQNMEALGRLAGGVAHDFNNLLTIISGYTALVHETLRDDTERAAMLEEVAGAANRASELTRQLLAFSRRESKQLRPLDLNESIERMHALLRRLIGEDIEITITLSNECSKVQADPGQIGQVLMNLAANARDAMPLGGKISIQTENWSIADDDYHIQLGYQPGHYVRLLFTDTGAGMDPETQAHVFEPFFTTKEVGNGTGLGLSTVYGIVKACGGQISVYSELGHGTTFAIYFPCSSAPDHPSLELQHSEPPQGTETILLVEDEPSLRRLAASILTGSGYTVLEATNANEALSTLQGCTTRIDVLLTDIVMPGENGRRVALQISRMRPGIAVIYMSGYSDHATLESVLSDSGAAFLQKPFTPVQLLTKIRDVLRKE